MVTGSPDATPVGELPDRQIYARRERIIHRDIAGESILVPIEGQLADLQRIFSLNPIAAEIWQRLDGTRTVLDLRQEILAAYAVEEAQAQADLCAFLGDLLEAGLIRAAP